MMSLPQIHGEEDARAHGQSAQVRHAAAAAPARGVEGAGEGAGCHGAPPADTALEHLYLSVRYLYRAKV